MRVLHNWSSTPDVPTYPYAWHVNNQLCKTTRSSGCFTTCFTHDLRLSRQQDKDHLLISECLGCSARRLSSGCFWELQFTTTIRALLRLTTCIFTNWSSPIRACPLKLLTILLSLCVGFPPTPICFLSHSDIVWTVVCRLRLSGVFRPIKW